MCWQDKKIKCVIWDLDDTLWDGTLAEGDNIRPRHHLLKLIPALDQVGIVNSICSKNDPSAATNWLDSLALTKLIVFPIITFSPKGKNIRQIINLMQLRAENVLFVDDNPGNREEARYYSEGLLVADPNAEDFLANMHSLIQQTQGHSRLEHYRILEKKQAASNDYADNNEFLAASNICLCIIRNPEDLNFKERIIELANRSNQLNFTRSRFPDIEDFDAQFESDLGIHMNHGVVFVHDKFGHYGLVGFYAFDERPEQRNYRHLFFSCRILNMGVEQSLCRHLLTKHRVAPPAQLNMNDGKTTAGTHCQISTSMDAKTRVFLEQESEDAADAKTTVVAGCTSGMISHYLPSHMKPVIFDNFKLSNAEPLKTNTEHLVYTIYSDYINKGWRQKRRGFYRQFRAHLQAFLDANDSRQIYLILASERPISRATSIGTRLKHLEAKLLKGRSLARYKKCNAIIRELAAEQSNVHLVAPDDYIHKDSEQMDARHFDRVVIKRLCTEAFVEDS